MAENLFNGDLEYHEAANLFPLDDGTLYILVDDIRANGQIESIKLYEGKILDGRRRYLACKNLGIEPRFQTVKPPDPIAYSLSLNLKRRNLGPSDLAMVAARAETLYESERKKALERKRTAGGDRKSAEAKSLVDDGPQAIPDAGKTRDKVAEIVSSKNGKAVTGRTVDRARRVIRDGTPALIAAVDAKKLAVSTAALATDLPAEKQDAIAAEAMAEKRPRLHRPAPEPANEAMQKQKEKALDLAAHAKNHLANIPKNNPYREEAFQDVIKWIKRARKGD